MIADVGFEKDVHILNEWHKALGALKCVPSNKRIGINAKKCLQEGVIHKYTLHQTQNTNS